MSAGAMSERASAGDALADVAATLPAVVAAYGFAGEVQPLAGGLINRTYAIVEDGVPVAVLQRLHPVFSGEVNLDIEAVSAHLAACGMDTPRLLRTRAGELWIDQADGAWRALSFVPGHTRHRVDEPAQAHAAAVLVGRFHRALDSLRHDYVHVRAGVHDTAAHLARLRGHLEAAAEGDELQRAGVELGGEILALATALPALPQVRMRHSHGDLKISNLLFADDGSARCLVDLDTVGRQSVAYELGDAMRSWCNPQGEDADQMRFDGDIFAAAMAGYREGAGDLLDAEERAAIVAGTEWVCVELAARFCVDVFADAYFGWDAQRYPSRRAHNLARARGQLMLARSVSGMRSALYAAV
ncbi:phosphotransferase enzyme family protein [Haliangium ochraceum]|uniref:Aminoglycoside phosphotransferase n=1 Tax=Haliangium ochraceum (strain DSM 14365 / JCM 11303 / SMP-2) TaxID=502025 RepID=D0LHD9_HALO1|nr:aminoglycoside phosphotransferase family protein [Haliangium ochraceum]ACY18284.1 aminoglycoside phosphotransferase [Haliangium ochraceum DSM 14365]